MRPREVLDALEDMRTDGEATVIVAANAEQTVVEAGNNIEPQSVAADQETERKVRTFRVLKRVGTIPQATRWDEQSTPYETIWQPDAQEIGEQYGEGHYLLIESDSKYDFHYVYPMRVVAEKRYRLADDETT